MVKYELWDTRLVAIKTVEKIASLRNMKICHDIDKDYNVVVYIPDLALIKNKRYLRNLEGRGDTYAKACEVFIYNLMDIRFNVRYKDKYYITYEIRSYVESLNVKYLYQR